MRTIQKTLSPLLIALMGACMPGASGDGGGGTTPPPGGTTTPPGGSPTQPGQPPAPQGPDQAAIMQRFQGCMTDANWQASNMQTVMLNSAQFGSGCFSCHSGGQGGLFANANATLSFQKTKETFAAGLFVVDGNQVVPNYARLENAGNRPNHPLYVLTGAARQSLEQFAQLTNACGGQANFF